MANIYRGDRGHQRICKVQSYNSGPDVCALDEWDAWISEPCILELSKCYT